MNFHINNILPVYNSCFAKEPHYSIISPLVRIDRICNYGIRLTTTPSLGHTELLVQIHRFRRHVI